jgi:hypothetical protein
MVVTGKGYVPELCYVDDCRHCIYAPCDAWMVRRA